MQFVTISPVSLSDEPSIQKPRTMAQTLPLKILRLSVNSKVTAVLTEDDIS